MHNTPVVNILKGYFCIIFFWQKPIKKPTWNLKFQLNLSMHVYNCVFSLFWVPKGALLLQKLMRIDDTRTWSVVQLNKVICKISAQYIREKCEILSISSILSYKRGITPTKSDGNWRHSNLLCTVKPAWTVTSVKRSPANTGQFLALPTFFTI